MCVSGCDLCDRAQSLAHFLHHADAQPTVGIRIYDVRYWYAVFLYYSFVLLVVPTVHHTYHFVWTYGGIDPT